MIMNKLNSQKGNSTVIGIVVVIIILLAGAIYMWKSSQVNTSPAPVAEMPVEDQLASPATLDNQATQYSTQSNSDDLKSIETDLKATSFTNL